MAIRLRQPARPQARDSGVGLGKRVSDASTVGTTNEPDKPRRGRPRKGAAAPAKTKPGRSRKTSSAAQQSAGQRRTVGAGKAKTRARGSPAAQDRTAHDSEHAQPAGKKRKASEWADDRGGASSAQGTSQKRVAGGPRRLPRKPGVEPSSAGPAALTGSRKGMRERRRRSSAAAEENDGDGEEREADDGLPSPERSYPHVAPAVRRVRQSTIDEKWSPLAEPCVAVAAMTLELAHRPVLQRLSTAPKRHAQAAAALHLVTRRIIRKLSKGLPFPPALAPPTRGGAATTPSTAIAGRAGADPRAAELDFERVLDGRLALERQLDPGLDALELLRREKARVERELARDYDTLKTLENRARAQGRQHRALLKKAHMLVPKQDGGQSSRGDAAGATDDDDAELVFRSSLDQQPGNVFKVLNTTHLQPPSPHQLPTFSAFSSFAPLFERGTPKTTLWNLLTGSFALVLLLGPA